MKCILNHLPDILPQALGPVRLITSQFMVKHDNREDQRISQTHCMATHDAPWSFLLTLKLLIGTIKALLFKSGLQKPNTVKGAVIKYDWEGVEGI